MRPAILRIAFGAAAIAALAQTPDAADKYIWLEDVHGEKPMAWVKAENERTLKVLQSDPRFAALQKDALAILESPDRLAFPEISGDDIYNTWKDAAHPRGLLRATSFSDYLTPNPHWRTLIDYDALAKTDRESWVEHGSICLQPANELCMVALSAGGEDAATFREFNRKTGKFVEGGFVLPKSKQQIGWLDKDTLLVARDWGAGTMTKSGYAFVMKRWKRGEPLSSAKEIYRGAATDEGAMAPSISYDGEGHRIALIVRYVTFFEPEVWMVSESGDSVERLGLPAKIRLGDASIEGAMTVVHGNLIALLDGDWKPEGQGTTFAKGSVIALNIDAMRKDPAHLKPSLVFAPTAREFAQELGTTKDALLLTTLDNVQGRAYLCRQEKSGTWSRKRLSLPDNLAVAVESDAPTSTRFFLNVSGFTTPGSLWLGDTASGTVKEAKTVPPKYDASGIIVEQLEAISKDGTHVPYFVARRKDLKFDGSAPTLMTAYGGFQIPMTPSYIATPGKLWLERGGVFVLANIRGGGEFGPAWHDAGLKTHRQRIYDDFAAVAQDLIKRRITSPRRFGIYGGSNGGLLMGVEMTQHPDLWNAVCIQVPLLDMLRFEQIAAGASWVAEYGTVKNPEERAFLASISPYHQLKPGVKYPEPLIFTTTKDDRVGPVHARKFAAKMAEYHLPYLYYETIEGGHGTGADAKEQARSTAVQYTYFMRKLMD